MHMNEYYFKLFLLPKKKKKGQITTIEEDNQMNGQL